MPYSTAFPLNRQSGHDPIRCMWRQYLRKKERKEEMCCVSSSRIQPHTHTHTFTFKCTHTTHIHMHSHARTRALYTTSLHVPPKHPALPALFDARVTNVDEPTVRHDRVESHRALAARGVGITCAPLVEPQILVEA